MNVIKEFPSEFITAADLIGPDGKSLRPALTVKGLAKGSARDPKTGNERTVPELSFRESVKRIRLNRSSLLMLVRAWGSESDGWTGHQVTLEILATNLTDKTTGEKRFAVLVRPIAGAAAPTNGQARLKPATTDQDAAPPQHSEGCDDPKCRGECARPGAGA